MALKGFVILTKTCSTDEKFLNLHRKQEDLIARIEKQIQFTKEYQEIGIKVSSWQPIEQLHRVCY